MSRACTLCRLGVFLGLIPLILLGSCITPPTSAVTARITASVTSGDPPLTVTFSADGSSSQNEGELTYAWDFAGAASATTLTATHTFANPGLYVVTLTVTDAVGEVGTTSVDIRVRGAAPTAVISADPTSGDAPLLVRLDGSGSSAPDDQIRDYIWDLGDGSPSSGLVAPMHVFSTPGTYTVTLTVRTGGGVEDTATVTITVRDPSDSTDTRTGSLQFNGGQFATLPLGAERQLSDWTFETWFKVTSTGGGPITTLGSTTVLVEVQPALNLIRFQVAGTAVETAFANMAGSWHHLALVNQAGGLATLYVNGTPLVSDTAGDQITPTLITVGAGFSGKLTDVRLWNTARSATAIATALDRRLSSGQTGLLGYWRFNEGSGQTLVNRGTSAVSGVLGAGDAVEDTDPAWSADGPTFY